MLITQVTSVWYIIVRKSSAVSGNGDCAIMNLSATVKLYNKQRYFCVFFAAQSVRINLFIVRLYIQPLSINHCWYQIPSKIHHHGGRGGAELLNNKQGR